MKNSIESFETVLSDLESRVMEKAAELDEGLSDESFAAATNATLLAVRLFEFSHDLAGGLPAHSIVAQQEIRDLLTGLSELADQVFPNDEAQEMHHA